MKYLKIIRDFITKHAAAFVLLFFVLYFIYGLCCVDDYGVPGDEFFEVRSSDVNFKYIFLDFIQRKSDIPTVQSFLNDTEEINEFEDRYYGVALQLPMTFLEYLRNFSLDKRYVILSRHYWVFLNFFVAMLCFYLTLRKRFASRGWGLLGVVFIIFSPKIFAESFYNIKDILFLSWVSISLYFAQRFIGKKTIWNATLLALSTALAANARLYGLLLIPLVLFCILLEKHNDSDGQRDISLFVYLALSAFFVIIFSPVLWQNPIREFIASLAEFSRFHHSSDSLIFGKVVPGNLIWYYLPINIWVTSPMFITTLFCLGCCIVLTKLSNRHSSDGALERSGDLIMLAYFFLPILFQVISHSTVYDGWRHYYFLYLPLTYLALSAFRALWQLTGKAQRLTRFALCMCLALSLINSLSWMLGSHSFEYLYVNPLMQSRNTEFPRDYYGLSHRAVLEDLASMAQDDERLEVTGRNSYYTYNNYLLLPKTLRSKLAVYSYSDVFSSEYYILIYQYDAENEIEIPYYRRIKDYETHGVRYASLYQLDDDEFTPLEVMITDSKASHNAKELYLSYDNNIESQWNSWTLQNEGDFVEFEFDQPYTLNRIDMNNHLYLGYAQNPKLFCSEDMRNWQPMSLTRDYDRLRLIFDETTCKGIRISNQTESDRYWTISELAFYGKILE